MLSFDRPNAVKELNAVHRDGRMDLFWSYGGEQKKVVIKGFRLYRAEGNSEYILIAQLPPDATRYSDTDIGPGKRYRYKIQAFSSRGVDSESSMELKVRPVNTPAVPEGLKYHITNDFAEISWAGAEKGVTFNIFRSENKGVYPGTPLNGKPLEEPFFRDRLHVLNPVYYSVVAVIRTDIMNESGMSAELLIDPKIFVPAAPADVRIVRSDNRVYISWQDNDETWVRGYRVYRKGTSGVTELLAEVNVPIYVDEDRGGAHASYHVTAFGPFRESGSSAEARTWTEE
jgi:hypothetical protein